MSKFQTRIPVPVQQVLDALPGGSFVHSYTYDEQKQELTVVWESEAHHTGYTFAVDVTVEELASKRRLAKFKAKSATVKPPKPENAPNRTPEVSNAPLANVPDHNWDKERFDKEKSAGTAIECQGVEPVWKALGKDDVWQEGFLYRKSGVDTPPKAS